jgi:hypothetical protein
MWHESVISASLLRIVEVEPRVNGQALLHDTQLVMDHYPLSLFLKKVINPNIVVIETGFDSSSQNTLERTAASHHLLGKDYIPCSIFMHYSIQLYCMCLTPK